MLENTLESPLDSREIKSVNPKGNQPWMFIGSTGAEAEAPLLWPPDAKSDSLQKTLMLGRIESRRRRGWQRIRWLDDRINSRDMSLSKLRAKETWFDPWVRKILWRRAWQPTPVVLPEESHGQRSLVGYSPWGHKESQPHGRVLVPKHSSKGFNLKSNWTIRNLCLWTILSLCKAACTEFHVGIMSEGNSHVNSFTTDPWTT